MRLLILPFAVLLFGCSDQGADSYSDVSPFWWYLSSEESVPNISDTKVRMNDHEFNFRSESEHLDGRSIFRKSHELAQSRGIQASSRRRIGSVEIISDKRVWKHPVYLDSDNDSVTYIVISDDMPTASSIVSFVQLLQHLQQFEEKNQNNEETESGDQIRDNE